MEEKISELPEKHKTNVYTYLTTLAVNILNFSFGTTYTWSSPTLFKLQHEENNPFGYFISDNEASWIASLVTLGTAIGTIPLGYLATKIGRKPPLLIVALLFFVSSIMVAFGRDIWIFYVSRFIAGVAVGAGMSLSASYISEISHHTDRALLNVSGAVFMSLGALMPYATGPYMSIMAFNLFLAAPPAVFFVVFSLFMVETPHYLVSKNRHQEAYSNLKKFRNNSPSLIASEHEALQIYIKTHDEGTLIDIFKSRILIKNLFVILFLITAQQLSAVPIIISYTQEIFEASEINVPSDKAAIIFSGIQFVFCFGPMFVLPRFKFRTLLVSCQILLVISLGIIGTFFYFKEETNFDTSSLGSLPIASAVGIIIAYAYGIGSIPPIITTELFPTNLRSLALTLQMTLGALEGFLVVIFYLSLADKLGTGPVYWFFSGCSGIAAILVVFYVPETNGKTFQEIQDVLRKKG